MLCGGNFKGHEFVPAYIKTVRQRLKTLQLPHDKADYLVRNYGKQCNEILDLARTFPENSLIKAEALFTLQNEGAVHLEDFFIRRTGKLYFYPSEVPKEIDAVAEVFAKHNGWTKTMITREKKTVLNILKAATNFSQ